jgi:hypothetical protein
VSGVIFRSGIVSGIVPVVSLESYLAVSLVDKACSRDARTGLIQVEGSRAVTVVNDKRSSSKDY